MRVPFLNASLRHADVLSVGQRIALDADQLRALRLREINVKEAFTIGDRQGQFFRASLTSASAGGGEALVYEGIAGSPESPADITLVCAVLARQRMLGVIQKATELGVMRVLPVLSERSVQSAGLEHEKSHAWPAQAVRAARQCRRASLPEVRATVPLLDALEDECFHAAERRVYLDDRATNSASETTQINPTRIAFVVGPEGGFTDAERRLLEQKGATPLRIGGRVLRAETAVLVGLTLLQHLYGDM